MSKAVRALYRLFLCQARDLQRQGVEALCIRLPLNKEAWLVQQGAHDWAPPRDVFYLRAFQKLAPWAAEGATSGCLSPAELRSVVRRSFRQPPAGSSREEQLDRAFQSLRLLSEQLAMQRSTSSALTEGVHVEVTSGYIGTAAELDPSYEEEEEEEEGGSTPPKRYFTYRVRVSNLGQDNVRLQGRHWLVQDGLGQTLAEVPKGSRGVVGCTPLLRPGECFEYYSGTDLECPSGSMRGSFQMAVVDGPDDPPLRMFDAEVAPFPLVPPKSS